MADLVEPQPKRKPKKLKATVPPRYKRNEKTTGGVEQRARRRLKSLGSVDGVNEKDGISGGEARKIRRSYMKDKPGPRKGRGPSRRNGPREEPGIDSLTRELNALTRLQYGPQERQLAQERRTSEYHSRNLASWYDQYQQNVAQQTQQFQAYQSGLQAGLQNQANMARQQDAQYGLTLQQNAQSVPGATPGVVPDQQAAASRQALNNSFGGMVAAQGQAQSAHFNQQTNSVGGYKVQALQEERNRLLRIQEIERELAAEKGAFRVKAKADIEDADRQAALEEAAFGLDLAEERNDVRNERRDDRRDSRSDRADRRDDRADNRRADQDSRERARHNRETEANARRQENRMRAEDREDDGKLNGSNKYTQSQRNSNQREFREARGYARDLEGFSAKEKLDVLTKKEGIDPLIARAVLGLSLSRRQRMELRRMGIRPRRNPVGEAIQEGGRRYPG